MTETQPELSTCERCHHDARMHAHFTGTSRLGPPFRWRVPKVVTWAGKTADPIRLRVRLNRYPHNVIGIALVVMGRQFVLNWKRPRHGR